MAKKSYSKKLKVTWSKKQEKKQVVGESHDFPRCHIKRQKKMSKKSDYKEIIIEAKYRICREPLLPTP